MKIGEMRAELIKAYPNDTWEKRVRTMPDAQVIAVHRKFANDNAKRKKEQQG